MAKHTVTVATMLAAAIEASRLAGEASKTARAARETLASATYDKPAPLRELVAALETLPAKATAGIRRALYSAHCAMLSKTLADKANVLGRNGKVLSLTLEALKAEQAEREANSPAGKLAAALAELEALRASAAPAPQAKAA